MSFIHQLFCASPTLLFGHQHVILHLFRRPLFFLAYIISSLNLPHVKVIWSRRGLCSDKGIAGGVERSKWWSEIMKIMRCVVRIRRQWSYRHGHCFNMSLFKLTVLELCAEGFCGFPLDNCENQKASLASKTPLAPIK